MSRLGPTLGMHGAVLASGTALALHLGHRSSADLQFFAQRSFRPSDILEELRALATVVEPAMMGDAQMIARVDGAEVSLTQTPARFAGSTTRVNGCDVAAIEDIAGMTLMAMSHEGIRVDFVDLYAVLQTLPFRRIAHNVLERYGASVVEPIAIGKGLVWFERADAQPDPSYVGVSVRWDSIKSFFRSSLRQFVLDVDAERRASGQG